MNILQNLEPKAVFRYFEEFQIFQEDQEMKKQ